MVPSTRLSAKEMGFGQVETCPLAIRAGRADSKFLLNHDYFQKCVKSHVPSARLIARQMGFDKLKCVMSPCNEGLVG